MKRDEMVTVRVTLQHVELTAAFCSTCAVTNLKVLEQRTKIHLRATAY